MYGKSFLLIKPDGVEKKIIKEVIESITEASLSIVRQDSIFLSQIDIMNIWPYAQSDIVSRQLLFKYLLNKECILFLLEALEVDIYCITSNIKRSLRKKYGVHQYLSVVHSPSSKEEYEKDISVFQKKRKKLIKNDTIIGDFRCYQRLRKTDVSLLCHKIDAYLNGKPSEMFENYGKIGRVIYLNKNGINDSYYLAGILCDELGYSLDMSFYLAISVNYFGQFPVVNLGRSDYSATFIEELFSKYGYEIHIEEEI